MYIYPLNGNLLKLKKCWLATNIDYNICNIHNNPDRWIIIVEQNVRLQGSMHPVKFLSRGRGGGLWWPAGLLLIAGLNHIQSTNKYIGMMLAWCWAIIVNGEPILRRLNAGPTRDQVWWWVSHNIGYVISMLGQHPRIKQIRWQARISRP